MPGTDAGILKGNIPKAHRMPLAKLETSKLLIAPTLSSKGLKILSGISPDGYSEWEFQLTPSKMEHVAKISMGAAKELAFNVPFVLKEKNALVFQGIRTDGHKEGLCYIGRPHIRYHSNGKELSLDENAWFLVFINEERIIYHWIWETIPAMSLANFVPERFAGRIR